MRMPGIFLGTHPYVTRCPDRSTGSLKQPVKCRSSRSGKLRGSRRYSPKIQKRCRIRAGWRYEWTSPSRLPPSSNLAIREVVRGPFSSPRLVTASPFVVLSSYDNSRPRCREEPRREIRRGIPDPWTEYLAYRGLCSNVERRVVRRDLKLGCESLHVTENVWKELGLPLGQGIPDPWRDWPSQRRKWVEAEEGQACGKQTENVVCHRKNKSIRTQCRRCHGNLRRHEAPLHGCPCNGTDVQNECTKRSTTKQVTKSGQTCQPELSHPKDWSPCRTPIRGAPRDPPCKSIPDDNKFPCCHNTPLKTAFPKPAACQPVERSSTGPACSPRIEPCHQEDPPESLVCSPAQLLCAPRIIEIGPLQLPRAPRATTTTCLKSSKLVDCKAQQPTNVSHEHSQFTTPRCLPACEPIENTPFGNVGQSEGFPQSTALGPCGCKQCPRRISRIPDRKCFPCHHSPCSLRHPEGPYQSHILNTYDQSPYASAQGKPCECSRCKRREQQTCCLIKKPAEVEARQPPPDLRCGCGRENFKVVQLACGCVHISPCVAGRGCGPGPASVYSALHGGTEQLGTCFAGNPDPQSYVCPLHNQYGSKPKKVSKMKRWLNCCNNKKPFSARPSGGVSDTVVGHTSSEVNLVCCQCSCPYLKMALGGCTGPSITDEKTVPQQRICFCARCTARRERRERRHNRQSGSQPVRDRTEPNCTQCCPQPTPVPCQCNRCVQLKVDSSPEVVVQSHHVPNNTTNSAVQCDFPGTKNQKIVSCVKSKTYCYPAKQHHSSLPAANVKVNNMHSSNGRKKARKKMRTREEPVELQTEEPGNHTPSDKECHIQTFVNYHSSDSGENADISEASVQTIRCTPTVETSSVTSCTFIHRLGNNTALCLAGKQRKLDGKSDEVELHSEEPVSERKVVKLTGKQRPNPRNSSSDDSHRVNKKTMHVPVVPPNQAGPHPSFSSVQRKVAQKIPNTKHVAKNKKNIPMRDMSLRLCYTHCNKGLNSNERLIITNKQLNFDRSTKNLVSSPVAENVSLVSGSESLNLPSQSPSLIHASSFPPTEMDEQLFSTEDDKVERFGCSWDQQGTSLKLFPDKRKPALHWFEELNEATENDLKINFDYTWQKDESKRFSCVPHPELHHQIDNFNGGKLQKISSEPIIQTIVSPKEFSSTSTGTYMPRKQKDSWDNVQTSHGNTSGNQFLSDREDRPNEKQDVAVDTISIHFLPGPCVMRKLNEEEKKRCHHPSFDYPGKLMIDEKLPQKDEASYRNNDDQRLSTSDRAPVMRDSDSDKNQSDNKCYMKFCYLRRSARCFTAPCNEPLNLQSYSGEKEESVNNRPMKYPSIRPSEDKSTNYPLSRLRENKSTGNSSCGSPDNLDNKWTTDVGQLSEFTTATNDIQSQRRLNEQSALQDDDRVHAFRPPTPDLDEKSPKCFYIS